jgi:hypothetical protein
LLQNENDRREKNSEDKILEITQSERTRENTFLGRSITGV